MQPEHSNFWDKLREGFSIHFHFAPGWMQLAGAVAMLALGFMAARMTPGSMLGSWHAASVVVEPILRASVMWSRWPRGGCRLWWTKPRSGRCRDLEDQSIQRLLLTAAKDPSDAGLRVESVNLLKNQPQSAEVRSAFLYAVQHDSNAGRPAEGLDGLKEFASDPVTRKTLTQVLLKDDSPGVRTQVIDLLIQHQRDPWWGSAGTNG